MGFGISLSLSPLILCQLFSDCQRIKQQINIGRNKHRLATFTFTNLGETAVVLSNAQICNCSLTILIYLLGKRHAMINIYMSFAKTYNGLSGRVTSAV